MADGCDRAGEQSMEDAANEGLEKYKNDEAGKKEKEAVK